MPVAVGIDFGSTHCNVGVWHHGRPEIIANHHGLRATPTMVAFTEHEVLVGEAALTQMAKNRQNTVYGFKWLVGQSHAQLEPHVRQMLEGAHYKSTVDKHGHPRALVTHKGEEKTVSADALCGHLFTLLASIAQQFSGQTLGKCVLSVPTSMDAEQREVLKGIGKQAGLPFSLVLSDPVATAIAYGLDRSDADISGTSREGEQRPKRVILVIDWGGGGLEATLLKRNDGVLSIWGVAADPSLGGGRFTDKMVDFCAEEFRRKYRADLKESKRALLKLERACEEAVRALSMSQQADVYAEALHEGLDLNVRISRGRFEDLCRDLHTAAGGPVRSVLESCGASVGEVDMVLLAGGIAQMPKVQSVFRGMFPPDMLFGQGLFSDEAVAIGATIQAFLLQDNANPLGTNQFPKDPPCCPVALGVRCLSPCTEAPVAVVRRGCLLPTQESVLVRVAADSGNVPGAVVLQIVEMAESANGGPDSELLPLANLVFDAVPAAAEVEFQVGMTLKAEGLLKVEAMEMSTKALQEAIVRCR